MIYGSQPTFYFSPEKQGLNLFFLDKSSSVQNMLNYIQIISHFSTPQKGFGVLRFSYASIESSSFSKVVRNHSTVCNGNFKKFENLEPVVFLITTAYPHKTHTFEITTALILIQVNCESFVKKENKIEFDMLWSLHCVLLRLEIRNKCSTTSME